MSRTRAAIRAIAYHLPEAVLTNAQLERELDGWDDAKIFAKTGIAARHVAAAGECASDLAVKAARALFDSGISARDVDFLLFCTQSPDHYLPTTACLLQDRLGLSTWCGALDVSQGCSGFVYGLALARGLVEDGLARNVLLLTADTYTKYVNPRDRSTRTIFGDGAAATLVGPADAGPGEAIGPFVFGTDGRGAANLIVPAGAARTPHSAATAVEREDRSGNWRCDDNIFMNGAEVFAFTLAAVPAAVGQLLERAGLALDDVDHFVFHQANRYMLERLRDKIGIPPAKFVVELEDTGNTVSASIPIALHRRVAGGAITPGDRIMVVGFGVGYSWAAAMVRWAGTAGGEVRA